MRGGPLLRFPDLLCLLQINLLRLLRMQLDVSEPISTLPVLLLIFEFPVLNRACRRRHCTLHFPFLTQLGVNLLVSLRLIFVQLSVLMLDGLVALIVEFLLLLSFGPHGELQELIALLNIIVVHLSDPLTILARLSLLARSAPGGLSRLTIERERWPIIAL